MVLAGLLLAVAVVFGLILPALANNGDYGIATNSESANSTPAATQAPSATPTATATSVLDTLAVTPWPTVVTCPSGQVYNSATQTCVSPLSLPVGNPESP